MDFMFLHQQFHESHMALNPGTCHYMAISNKKLSHEIMLNHNEVTSSNEEKLLCILLDSKLNFKSHIVSLCRKADQKINVLAGLRNYLTSDQRNVLFNSIIKSHFSYCSLMFFTPHHLNNALNNIHEQVQSQISNYHNESFNSINYKK